MSQEYSVETSVAATKVLRDTLNDRTLEFTDDSDLTELGVDSSDLLCAIFALEKEFDVPRPTEKTAVRHVISTVRTFRDLCMYVEGQRTGVAEQNLVPA